VAVQIRTIRKSLATTGFRTYIRFDRVVNVQMVFETAALRESLVAMRAPQPSLLR
jgi:hypothetical protein